MNFFNKVAKAELDRATQQLLELETKKKRLEIERDQIALELDNQKKRMDMVLEQERHKQTLKLQSEVAVFEREREIWKKEKADLEARYKRENEEFENRLKKDFEIKLTEAVTLTKLESQQLIKQAELDKERKISELQVEMAQKIAVIQEEESKNHYNKLTQAFETMQLHGDKNTKFVQELALKILDKTPSSKVGVDVNVEGPKQLTN